MVPVHLGPSSPWSRSAQVPVQACGSRSGSGLLFGQRGRPTYRGGPSAVSPGQGGAPGPGDRRMAGPDAWGQKPVGSAGPAPGCPGPGSNLTQGLRCATLYPSQGCHVLLVSSTVERSAVNRGVAGSNPAPGARSTHSPPTRTRRSREPATGGALVRGPSPAAPICGAPRCGSPPLVPSTTAFGQCPGQRARRSPGAGSRRSTRECSARRAFPSPGAMPDG